MFKLITYHNGKEIIKQDENHNGLIDEISALRRKRGYTMWQVFNPRGDLIESNYDWVGR